LFATAFIFDKRRAGMVNRRFLPALRTHSIGFV
jgi:hypothetical protein